MSFQRRRPRRRTIVSCASSTLLALCLLASAGDAQAPTPKAQPQSVSVQINRLAPGQSVPARFLGLSFEAAALSQIASYAHHGDLVALLRSLGRGMLRFGGVTADENVAFTEAGMPAPKWASQTIAPAQFRSLGELVRHSGWTVLLTVGMAHDEPSRAAHEVAAAHRALGSYLAAVEIGNEPNSYGAHGFRTLPWIAQGYEEEVGEYRQAIEALTPEVPIAGPDVSGSAAFPEWGEEEALSQQPVLLTGHHYPLGCAQVPPPSIEALLSPMIRERELVSLETYMKVAQRNSIPLRIDESGSVSCGGVAGISNTFASALWATSYIAQTMAAQTAGINLESNPVNCSGYTPLCALDPQALANGELHAQPAWYALLLTGSLIGDHPLPSSYLSSSGSPNLVVQAFATPNGSLQVVLVDDEPPSAPALALQLNVGAGMGQAHLLQLTAPSQQATTGVLLGGHEVSRNGSIKAPAHPRAVSSHAGILSLEVKPSSAELVTIERRSTKASTG